MTWYTTGHYAALTELGIKTADAVFPKLKTDPFSEIQRRLNRVFKLKTTSYDLTKDIARLFKNPLQGVRLRRI